MCCLSSSIPPVLCTQPHRSGRSTPPPSSTPTTTTTKTHRVIRRMDQADKLSALPHGTSIRLLVCGANRQHMQKSSKVGETAHDAASKLGITRWVQMGIRSWKWEFIAPVEGKITPETEVGLPPFETLFSHLCL